MSNQYQYRKADKGIYGPVPDSPSLLQSWTLEYYYEKVKEWKESLKALPRVASVPSSNWKDGEIVEEGKRFTFRLKSTFTPADKEPLGDTGCKDLSHGFSFENIAVPFPEGNKKGLNLVELERKVDEALAKETPESLNAWLDSQVKEEGTKPTDHWVDRIKVLSNDHLVSQYTTAVMLKNDSAEVAIRLIELRSELIRRIAATPSVDAGKETFSREQMIAFGKHCFYNGFNKAENDDANCYTAWREESSKLIDEYLNQLNKQK